MFFSLSQIVKRRGVAVGSCLIDTLKSIVPVFLLSLTFILEIRLFFRFGSRNEKFPFSPSALFLAFSSCGSKHPVHQHSTDRRFWTSEDKFFKQCFCILEKLYQDLCVRMLLKILSGWEIWAAIFSWSGQRNRGLLKSVLRFPSTLTWFVEPHSERAPLTILIKLRVVEPFFVLILIVTSCLLKISSAAATYTQTRDFSWSVCLLAYKFLKAVFSASSHQFTVVNLPKSNEMVLNDPLNSRCHSENSICLRRLSFGESDCYRVEEAVLLKQAWWSLYSPKRSVSRINFNLWRSYHTEQIAQDILPDRSVPVKSCKLGTGRRPWATYTLKILVRIQLENWNS